jgi:Uma2 family endonuclease
MSAQSVAKLTVEQYLELERKAEFRSEFYGGEIFAMAGGSPLHSFLIAAASRVIGNGVISKGCGVFVSDLRVHAGSSGLITYPDVAVICGPMQFLPGTKDTITNPVVLVEVLSPATEAYDRGTKFELYRQLPSLQEYVLVSQSRMHIEKFRREQDGRWTLTEASGEAGVIRLESVDCDLPLRDVYAGAEFEPAAASARPQI